MRIYISIRYYIQDFVIPRLKKSNPRTFANLAAIISELLTNMESLGERTSPIIWMYYLAFLLHDV